MAKCEMKMPEDFLLKLSKLGSKLDTAAPKALEEGAEVVLRHMKQNLKSVIGKDTKFPSRSKGDLEASLGITPALQDRNGNWNIRVGVGDSKDRNGVPNALKAQVLEYGKAGQRPKPWLKPARRKSRREVVQVMKSVLEREVKP